ncbi:hypothetical protein NQ318_000770 [Aromia moschata]|uniref:RNA-binding protein 18 n=1 Tax=Aromia moschata TaxID=1265417 RepID=A0AAV8YSR1_9CUCU|nr:hypothetical protein NQ318_000770 [Aromia moschata]
MENLYNTECIEERRLWIGNLDPRVTECEILLLVLTYTCFFYWYNLLKLVQKHGAIEKFDLIFHRNGPLAGQPRGYAFEEVEKPKPDINIPALAMSKEGKKADRISQIQAIEAKLKLMENKREDELKINDTVATKPPVIVQYQYNKTQVANNTLKHRQSSKKNDRYNKPYSKNKHRR